MAKAQLHDSIKAQIDEHPKHRHAERRMKVRRMNQDEEFIDFPVSIDAIANNVQNSQRRDIHLTASATVEEKIPTMHEVSSLEEVEISTTHKDNISNSHSDTGYGNETRELLSRRRPKLGYDINRSKKGSDPFIQKMRGKVGKFKQEADKRGKVGKLKFNNNGKSGKNGKSKSATGWYGYGK